MARMIEIVHIKSHRKNPNLTMLKVTETGKIESIQYNQFYQYLKFENLQFVSVSAEVHTYLHSITLLHSIDATKNTASNISKITISIPPNNASNL
jgi:hypothetical protein